jgi:hypothetical protein
MGALTPLEATRTVPWTSGKGEWAWKVRFPISGELQTRAAADDKA